MVSVFSATNAPEEDGELEATADDDGEGDEGQVDVADAKPDRMSSTVDGKRCGERGGSRTTLSSVGCRPTDPWMVLSHV